MNLIKAEREWVGKYIHHRNLLNKGRGELSYIEMALKLVAIPYGLAFAENIKQNPYALLFGVLGYMALCYFIGWWWDKRHHFDQENEWGNQRNPLANDIRRAIKK